MVDQLPHLSPKKVMDHYLLPIIEAQEKEAKLNPVATPEKTLKKTPIKAPATSQANPPEKTEQ